MSKSGGGSLASGFSSMSGGFRARIVAKHREDELKKAAGKASASSAFVAPRPKSPPKESSGAKKPAATKTTIPEGEGGGEASHLPESTLDAGPSGTTVTRSQSSDEIQDTTAATATPEQVTESQPTQTTASSMAATATIPSQESQQQGTGFDDDEEEELDEDFEPSMVSSKKYLGNHC